MSWLEKTPMNWKITVYLYIYIFIRFVTIHVVHNEHIVSHHSFGKNHSWFLNNSELYCNHSLLPCHELEKNEILYTRTLLSSITSKFLHKSFFNSWITQDSNGPNHLWSKSCSWSAIQITRVIRNLWFLKNHVFHFDPWFESFWWSFENFEYGKKITSIQNSELKTETKMPNNSKPNLK